MEGLNPSNITQPIYIDHNNFHVYVELISETTNVIQYTEFVQVNSLVQDAIFSDKCFELRLNENKDYTIKLKFIYKENCNHL